MNNDIWGPGDTVENNSISQVEFVQFICLCAFVFDCLFALKI